MARVEHASVARVLLGIDISKNRYKVLIAALGKARLPFRQPRLAPQMRASPALHGIAMALNPRRLMALRHHFLAEVSSSPPCRASARPAASSASHARLAAPSVSGPRARQPRKTSPPDRPCLRQRSAQFAPESRSCTMTMVCSPLRRSPIIVHPFPGADSSRDWRKNPLVGHSPRCKSDDRTAKTLNGPPPSPA